MDQLFGREELPEEFFFPEKAVKIENVSGGFMAPTEGGSDNLGNALQVTNHSQVIPGGEHLQLDCPPHHHLLH